MTLHFSMSTVVATSEEEAVEEEAEEETVERVDVNICNRHAHEECCDSA